MSNQRITMSIKMVDETIYDLKILPGDIVKAERNFSISATQIDQDPRLEHILYMAWLSSKRHQYAGTFDEFCDSVEDINVQTAAANPSSPVL